VSGPIENLTDAELAAFARDGNSKAAEAHLAVMRCMRDVKAERVDWVWAGILPAARLVLAVGDPGSSKSLLACDMAARITRASPWPDGQPGATLAGDVLIMAAEDSPGDYRTRLDAANADCSRVHILEAVRLEDGTQKAVTLADIDAINDAVSQLAERGREVKLIVIDTVSALLPTGVDDSKNSDVRGVLRPLAALAEETGATVLAIHHLRKSGGSAMHRTLGSVGWTAAARAVLAIARDPEDKTRRLLVVAKSNYSPEDGEGALVYAVQPDQMGRPVLAWETGRTDITADDALAVPEPGSTRAEGASMAAAQAWLRASLAEGPVAKKELAKVGRVEGYTLRTLERATEKMPDLVKATSGYPAASTWALKGVGFSVPPTLGGTGPVLQFRQPLAELKNSQEEASEGTSPGNLSDSGSSSAKHQKSGGTEGKDPVLDVFGGEKIDPPEGGKNGDSRE